ncbi:hypothetical protein K280104A7_33400 [Candidatus Bariatricus faecipullorum]
MYGIKLLANSHRKMMNEYPSATEEGRKAAEREQETLDWLAEKTVDDIYTIYDTGMFNDITRAYMIKAMKNIGLTEEQKCRVLEELKWLQDTQNAETVSRKTSI